MRLHILTPVILVIIFNNNVFVCAGMEFKHQPQLFADNRNLIIETARDQNITLRLVGDAAALLINDVNIVDTIKKRFSTNLKLDEDNEQATEILTSDAIVLQIKGLKRDLQRMSFRLSNAENHTQATQRSRRLRQFLMRRVGRVFRRLALIENLLSANDCAEKDVCKNGGICYDLYKDFYCECPEGWTGKSCDEDVDECYMWAGTDFGCQNNAVCINTLGSYRCNCTSGYSGTHCRLRNAVCDSAQSSELCGHGICVPANNALGYTCLCNQGWSRDNITMACTADVNECDESRNPCHNTCINLPGSFKCGPCPQGFTGNGMMCVDINECAQNNGGCSILPRVQCINTEGSYHCGNCPIGWLGDGHNCEKAQSNSCDAEGVCHPRAKCVYISDMVVCTCQPGWFGHGFGNNGCLPGANAGNPCDKHECKNNATCIASGRGTRCICPLGFSGPLCETNDACNPNPCRNGGNCKLLPANKFRCSCPRGTTGNNCEYIRNTCGSIINQEVGELTYPPDGGNYEPNEKCAWIIRTASTKVLNVTFSKFDLEEYPDCGKDWLQIHDGRSLAAQMIGRFCGKSLPLGGNFTSSHQQLFLWFRSDNATNGGGLKMSWTSQEHTCGGELILKANDNGVIRSPGYPGKTPANRECEWRFIAPLRTRLIFRIYEVILGGNENCTGDSLKIFDSDQLLETICTTKLPEPKHTSSNFAQVHFHTDSYRADSSFQLHYEVAPGDPNCGGFYTDASGEFEGNVGVGVCLYLIQLPVGTKIKLDFPQLERVARSAPKSCILHKVEIFDGKTDEAPLLKNFCAGDSRQSITSSGNNLLVRYAFLIPPLEGHIFQAKYSLACDDSFFGPDGGIFTTPNYPNPYYDHITCTYDIYGPLDTVVHVNFTDFSISETIPDMSEDESDINVNQQNRDVNDFANYVDVYISNNVKRRYYKGEAMHLVSSKNRMRIVFHSSVNQRKSRGLRVEYSFESLNCGGVLTENEGSFSEYALSESLAKYCEWILEAPEGKQIKLELSYSRIGAKCAPGDTDLLIFSNSSISGDRLVGSYCERDRSISTTFAHNLITIILKKIPTEQIHQTLYALKANYSFVDDQIACGGNFSYGFGVIKTPAYPKPYPPLVDCTWLITAPLGHKIELIVQNFSLETTSVSEKSEDCFDDYLEIRDGPSKASPLIGKYCGSSIPSRLPSFSNHLHLYFHSDRYISDAGFYITWEQTATGCGGKLNSHTGSIHSPHYPEISADAVVCDWLITVAKGSRIIVMVTPTQANADFCHNNVLTIYDGPNMLSRAFVLNCSTTQNTIELRSSTHQVSVRYALANGAQGGQQFLLDYKTDCVTQINDLQGAIESPNFPENYPPLMHCAWDIRGGRNNKIAMTFSHLKVEENQMDCKYDYVEVIDMRDEEVLKTRHLCTKPVDALETEGNRLLLKFVSDYSGSAQGFHAEFKRLGCGEHLQKERGRIESPNAPYSVDVDCDWFIEVSIGSQIVLTINEMHIETESHDCSDDVLTVTNEKSSVLYLLKECQISQKTIVTSMANRMFIHFHTSAKRARKYFKATYTTKNSATSCGGTFLGKQGLITSPNYPAHYSPSSVCVWNIFAEDTYGIKFQFDHFDLPSSNDCQDTFLQFKHFNAANDSDTIPLCGSQIPARVTTYKNQMEVYFQAGTLPPQTGFALRYKAKCGGILTEGAGYIKSGMGENCSWLIETDEGAHISLNILHLECQCGSNGNCTDGVLITYDKYGKSYDTLCAAHPVNIFSAGKTMLVQTYNVYFRASYSSVQNSCGGILTSLEGHLASPYYPNTYPSNIECIWEIKATKSNSIELNFDMLNITSSEYCNQDFLEIRSSEGGSLLGLYCSNELPSETITSYENVWLKFRSVEGSTGAGFYLNWNYAHINSINGTEGVLESPPIYSVRQQAEPYYWRITVTRGNLIWLNFVEYHKGLQLFDGFDEVALAIDVQYSPWEFTSGSNVVLLKSSNADIELFKIEWKAISKDAVKANKTINECHEDIVLPFNAHVSLSSPGYPEEYANDLNCDWIIKLADPTQHAILKLLDADIEDVQNCAVDYLTISTSSNLQDWHQEINICTRQPKKKQLITTIHGTPNLKVNFHSDNSVSGRGFTASLTTACGSNMTGPVGTILFPHLLRTHIPKSSCLWHIEVRAGRRIEFTFDFGTKTKKLTEICEQYAIIYDGVDVNAPYLEPGQICNRADRKVKTLMSTSNHAIVKYNMSWSISEDVMDLWNLTYREYNECGGEVVLTHESKSINISTPHYPNIPHPHTECTMVVLAPAGESIQVEFVDRFDMNARYCSKEYVEFFDGSSELSNSLGRYCTKPDTLHTTGNALYMHYLTAVSEPRNGFRINVSIALCGGTFSGSWGEISSAGYPAIGAYPAHTSCDYRIKISSFSRVKLVFNDIHLPFDAVKLNDSDYLEIYGLYSETADDGLNDTPYAVLYGNVTEMPVLEIDSNEVLIRFKTFNSNHQYRGFKLKYERTHSMCLKDVSGESGSLTIGRKVHDANYIICRWKITVPKGQRVRLEFLNMPQLLTATTPNTIFPTTPRYRLVYNSIHRHSFSTSSAMITVYNNHLMQSLITKFDINSFNASEVIQSTDNLMLVRIQFPKSKLPLLKNIRAVYSSDEDSPCPKDINDENSGSISLQQLTSDRQGIRQNFYCKVRFTMNDKETLAFTINELSILLPYSYHETTAVHFQNDELSMPIEKLNTNISNTLLTISTKRGSVNFMQNDLVKILNFRATYRRHPCGGQFSLYDGLVIETPNIEEVGYGSLDCAWVLKTDTYNSGYRLLGNATLSYGCEEEYIKIYAESVFNSPPLATICRDSAPFNVTMLDSRFTLVVYHVLNYTVRQSHFSLVVEKALTCGSTVNINDKTGKTIVVDAKTYRNNMECVWDFITLKGFYLTLSFTGRVFIEDSVNCSKDYLELQRYEAGLWQQDERFCGRVVPAYKNLTSNQLRIIFRTDNAITADGFHLKVTPTCDVSMNVTSATQVIYSPLFHSMQSYKIQCIYKLHTDTDQRINVRIVNQKNLRRLNRCEFFSITAYKQWDVDNIHDLTEIGKYCDEAELGGSKFLQLNLEAIIEKYVRIEFELDSCGGSVTAPTILHSLRNDEGDNYANNMNCVWNVTAPVDHSIALIFKHFEMEPNAKCRYDYLAIYNGPLVLDEKRTSKLCGNLTGRLPPVLMVDSNQAILQAISDDSSTYKGFLAELIFMKNCNERIALTDGNSPLTLVRHLAFQATEVLLCQYNIMAPAGFRIRVEIKDLKLGCALTDCERCNHIEIIDSVEAQRGALGKYCATGRSNISLQSSFEDMVLKVSAKRPGNYSFEIVLEMEESVCGGRSELLLDTEPLSLRYPAHNSSQYPSNAHCTWRIASNTEFQIEFDVFELQNASQVTGKCLDYLKIKTPYMSQDFCGNVTGYKMLIPRFVEATAHITFHSDALIEGKGFQLTIKHRKDCNRTYTATSGLISYSRPTSNYAICSDDISVPTNYTLAIYEYGFNLYMYQQNCSKYYIKIIDLVKNETLETFCRFVYSSKNVLTTSNSVRVEYTTNQLRLFYVASKKPAPPGCGGDIYTSEGVIENPPYDQDHNKSECRWDIVVPPTNKIRFTFFTFDMGASINCALDYLSFIEVGADNSEKVVQTYCGQETPSIFISQNNHIAVLAKKSQNFNGIGYRFRFETYENPDQIYNDLKLI